MRFIPRGLLIHSAQVKTPINENCFGAVSYSDSITLEHVRVDFAERLITSGTDRSRNITARLIYDCRNSLPRGFVFSLGQAVEFDGGFYTVAGIRKLYDKNRLHHIEADLI